ncbi:MAG TPA: hypothetical protein ENN87_17010, partial [Phycisphaerales bacterium]|nr:hypothetical protein [Phycisphaerales bacterium]
MATTKKRAKTTTRRDNKKPSAVAKIKQNRAFRTYDQAMKYLFERTDYERQQRVRYNSDTFDLGRMERLLDGLGNPHKHLTVAHIAGTKGKGSTATMLARMLEENGYCVGLYTSPHVVSLHERIVVNSRMITKKDMLGLINRVHATVEKMIKDSDAPTFFEIMTAMAFLYFMDRQVDLAIVET